MDYSHFMEPESALAGKMPTKIWGNVVVIPLMGESDAILNSFIQQIRNCLVIAVINHHAETPLEQILLNKKIWDRHAPPSTDFYFCPQLNGVDILFIRKEVPKKEGVGLARKLGCDIAYQLKKLNRIESAYIHTTDGDATIGPDYFELRDSSASAWVHPFEHVPCSTEATPEVNRATEIYDRFLRYYVAGLAYAESPYAFQTIGSAIAVRADSYAAVRGFPKKNAGEDFYLLNKVAKLGKVKEGGGKIQLRSRISDRVPFGTGASVKKITAQLLQDETPHFYSPRIFQSLHTLLKEWESFLDHQSIDKISRIETEFFAPYDLENIWSTFLKGSKSRETLKRKIEGWFDAFRTLKYVHYLDEHRHPEVPYYEAFESFR